MVDRMMTLYNKAISQKADRSFFEAMLSILNVRTKVSPRIWIASLERARRSWPTILLDSSKEEFSERCCLPSGRM
jgi:hypothetical protein